ncbi:MAG: TonB-dependent receptor [Tannerellaceae bacterium]|nr:TonB-dependent receptor [Tannerellaceae bacterium]
MNLNSRKTVLRVGICLAILTGGIPQSAKAYDNKTETAQQTIHLKGQVVDTTGEGVIGANIVQKGTTNGTITDLDGNFRLNVPEKATLTISFIGYQTQEIVLKSGETQIRVLLKEDTELLDEVVVVGYGTMKKRDLSGAVAQIKSDDLMKGNPVDLSQGLAGKVAGVLVNQSDGAPGGGVSIQIRGTNSFSTSSQPLYIVDGVPFDAGSTPSSEANSNSNQTSNPLSFINPHDIQSIEVLKDASATAIYGSRGANGVVIVTTKRGESGNDQVEFSANFGFSRIARRIKVLDAHTYAQYQNEQVLNDYKYSGKPYGTLPYPGKWDYSNNPDGTINTATGQYKPAPEDFLTPGNYTDMYGNTSWVGIADWQDLIYQSGFSQEYNISVSGGSDKGWHSFSGNYLDQSGIIKNSGFTRYSFRANIGRKITSWLEMGMNTSFTHTDTDFSKTNASDCGVIRSALIFPTTYDPNNNAAETGELSWLASNPLAYINSTKDHLKSIHVFNSSYVEIKLTPFLKFRQNLGISYTNNDRGTYYGRETQEGSATSNINGKAGQSSNWYKGITTESLFTFDKTFRIHTINAVAGFTAEKSDWASKSMSATGFPSDLTQYYDMSLGANPGQLQSDYGQSALASFLTRINYTLLDKYILTASYRADGSSKFTDKNKWAGFLSGAFAWRISEEKIIKDLNIFSNLKLRLSYGQTGNQGIGSYRTLPMLNIANYPFAGAINSGFAQVDWRGPVADNLRWETTSQYNAGLDIGFLDGRINFTVDYYYKKTHDLLQEVKIPSSTGFSNMMVNSGHVTNEGLEISGKFFILQHTPLKWNIDANISFNRNKIGGLASDQYANKLWSSADEVFIQRDGYPIGAIFGYVEDGFYDNLAEVMASPDPEIRAKGAAMTGEIKYRNFDDDPAITTADRVIIGDTNPDFVYGITNNFEWKNITFSFFLQGSQGNDIFNGNLMDIKMGNAGNITREAYNTRWTAENAANAKWPKAVSGYERNILISDRYVEDGSYLKLKNINIGYNWKPKFKGISSINIYGSATNLFTITGYSWFDPEVNAFGSDASRRGVDIYSYPASRTFSLGLKINF